MKGMREMLTYEYKFDGSLAQYAAIDEAICITQFIRNKCVCGWTSAASPRTICKSIVRCLPKRFPLPIVSTRKPVKSPG